MGARIFKTPLDSRYKKTFNNIIIKKLEKKFSKKDISFKAQNGHIVSKLRNIDLELLQKTVKILEKDFNILKNNSPLKELIQRIKKVKSYGIKGKKRVYDGYNEERKVINRKDKEKKRVLHYYALDNNFKKEENKIPDKYKNQIICGDSEKVLKNLPDNCVDLVFTYTPYNFGLDYASNDDAKSWTIYFEKLFLV